MGKEDIITLMVESINADNREICKQGGMSESDIEKNIEQSQPSLFFMLSNVYDKLKSGGHLA